MNASILTEEDCYLYNVNVLLIYGIAFASERLKPARTCAFNCIYYNIAIVTKTVEVN